MYVIMVADCIYAYANLFKRVQRKILTTKSWIYYESDTAKANLGLVPDKRVLCAHSPCLEQLVVKTEQQHRDVDSL